MRRISKIMRERIQPAAREMLIGDLKEAISRAGMQLVQAGPL